MPHQRCLCLILAGIGWFFDSSSGYAQFPDSHDPPRGYVQIPFEGNLDSALAAQLLRARDLRNLYAFLKKVLPPGKADLDLSQERNRDILKGLGKNSSPETQKAIDRLCKPEGFKISAGPADTKNATLPHSAPKQNQPDKLGPLVEEPTSLPNQPAVADDMLARWTRDLLKEADDWELDDMVKKSPALREGLKELQQLLPDGMESRHPFPSTGLARWAAGLGPQGVPMFKLPDLGWLKPKTLSLPSLPRPKVPLPRLGTWGDMPGLPRLGSVAHGGRAFGHGFLWIAVLGLAALVAWQLMRQWSGMRARGPGASWQPGPWPVNPADLATRADLIRAFEYLSLLQLGRAARTWNHRAIAAGLGGQDGCDDRRRLAADELAFLYEKARYAPTTDPFPAAALASARRDLCLLAGVASA